MSIKFIPNFHKFFKIIHSSSFVSILPDTGPILHFSSLSPILVTSYCDICPKFQFVSFFFFLNFRSLFFPPTHFTCQLHCSRPIYLKLLSWCSPIYNDSMVCLPPFIYILLSLLSHSIFHKDFFVPFTPTYSYHCVNIHESML